MAPIPAPRTFPSASRSRGLRLLGLGLLGAAIVGALAPTPVAAQNAQTVTSWYDGIRDAEPDPAAGVNVSGLVIERDEGQIELTRGTVHLLQPISGQRWGAVFMGEGVFRMTPPIRIEAEQVERTWGSRTIERPFRSAVMVFTGGELAELAAAGTPGAIPVDSDTRGEIEEALRYLSDGDGWIARDLFSPLLNDIEGYFYAHMTEDRDEPVIFAFDPRNHEEVTVWTRAEGRGRVREIVTSFERAEHRDLADPPAPEEGDLLDISHFDIEIRIEGNLDVEVRAVGTLEPTEFSLIPFGLLPSLEVQSIAWADGTPVEWYRPDGDYSDLWVDLGDRAGQGGDLVFTYESGDMLARPDDLFVTTEGYHYWYPLHEFNRVRTHRIRYDLPEDYRVASVGRMVDESVEDGRRITLWETPPVDRVAFNLGEFEIHESSFPGAPPVTLLYSPSAHRTLEDMLAARGQMLLSQRNVEEAVSVDILRSFAFFEQAFGPTVVDEFLASEIPYNHGEALPGVVLLSWNTFQFTDRDGLNQSFRAHEVAHQWWGVGVSPETLRDRWLAEGFSSFSGLWYAARSMGSLDVYLSELEKMRKTIMERRDRAVPLGFGSRAATSRDPGDYQVMIYDKGAWVLHMLRGLLTDPTGDDSAFNDLMRAFYTEHRGGTANTADFRRHAELAMGRSMGIDTPMDMGWFFDQWVYGNAIPTYHFSYTTDEMADGSVQMRVRIRQEDVPDNFRMVVPIDLIFGEQGSATVSVLVNGPLSEHTLPPLPMVPTEVVFNPREAVLAETKTEGWRN